MSWNEPNKKDEQGPPNMDEALRELQKKLRSAFGGKRTGPMGSNGDKNPSSSLPPLMNFVGTQKGVMTLLLIGVLIYILSGIYIVQPAEEAVVMRFGKYVGTVQPGPHWILRGVESKRVVNVQEINTTTHGGQMLTKDENIVNAEIAVQYRINNARDFLFNLVDPTRSVQLVSESALRQVVGESSLNDVLTSGRSEIGSRIRDQIQQNLNKYKSGIEISDLAVQQTKAPEEVKPAFDDAIKAQQDEERLVNESQAYARRVIPIAEGQAIRTLEEGKAYKAQVTLGAEGKTAKFAKILPEYQNAPKVTRERLYLDALQEVYANTSKVLIDVGNNNNNLVYLPLDKMMGKSDAAKEELASKEGDDSIAPYAKSNSTAISMQRSGNDRPSYDELDRQNQRGA